MLHHRQPEPRALFNPYDKAPLLEEDPDSKQRRPAWWQQQRVAIAVVALVIMCIGGFYLRDEGYFDRPGDNEEPSKKMLSTY